MKTILLAMLLAMNISTVLAGAGSSGGGDPLVIHSVPFPDVKILNEAISLAQHKVRRSRIPENYVKEFVQETKELAEANKYQVLPAIIVFNQDSAPEGHTLPGNMNEFLSLGATTNFEVGAPIYMAERVQTYNVRELAAVITHEILHHILPEGLSDDEAFVKLLTASIMDSVTDARLLHALNIGGYFRKDFVSRNAFIKLGMITETYLSVIKCDDDHQLCQDKKKIIIAALKARLPKDLSNWSLEHMLSRIHFTFFLIERQPSDEFRSKIINRMNELAKKVNPDYTVPANSTWGCNPQSRNNNCGHDSEKTMGELYGF